MPNQGISPEKYHNFQVMLKDRQKIYSIHFGSVGEIELFLKDDPDRNSAVFRSFRSEWAEEQFAGEPLPQAIAYCLGGYNMGYEQFLELANQLENVNRSYVPSISVEKSFVGQRPNVPAYIAGAPKTMYRMVRSEEKKVVNIFMNVAYTQAESEAQIRNRGIIVLNLINLLERGGYIVNFRLFEASMVKNEIFLLEVVLKKPGEKLNSRLCYYPMCGKAFLRRVLARIKESMPFYENWSMSYGTMMQEEQVKALLEIGEGDIYIGSPSAMGIGGADIYADADAFVEKLGIRDKIIVPTYRTS